MFVLKNIFIAVTSSFKSSTLEQHIYKLIMIFKTTRVGIEDPVCSVFINSHDEKIGCPDLSDFFVNGKIIIGKERERDFVSISEMLDFKGGIAGADPDQLKAVLKAAIILDFVVQFV